MKPPFWPSRLPSRVRPRVNRYRRRTAVRRQPERLTLEALEERRLLAIDSTAGFEGVYSPADVNHDGYLTALDALLVVSEVHRQAAEQSLAAASLPQSAQAADSPATWLDVNGDGSISIADAELVAAAVAADATDLINIRLAVTDLADNPITQINGGEAFRLTAYVLDLRSSGNQGVYGAWTDVAYESTLAATSSAINHGEYAGLSVSGTSTPGLLDEVGGGFTNILDIPGPDERLLWSVQFTAGMTPGTIHFVADPADTSPTHDSLLYGGGPVATTDISYGTAELLVIAPPAISIADRVASSEGTGANSTRTFTVTLSGPILETVTVDYMTQDGTALGGYDYLPASGMLTFLPGETEKELSVTVIGDVFKEADEAFTVVLSNPSGGGATFAKQTASDTILNDDTVIGITISDDMETEGDSGADPKSLTFTVTLSAPSDQQVTVDYQTHDVTALAGSDYVAQSDTLTFAPNETSKIITINLINDLLDEDFEFFTIQLSNPQNAQLDDSLGSGSIDDNDPVPVVQVANVTLLEPDSGTANMTFTVNLSKPSGKIVALVYETFSTGSATEGADYDSAVGQVFLNPGEMTTTVTVPIRADDVTELDETFGIRFTSLNDMQIATVEATGTITDADAPSVSIGPATIIEGTGSTPVQMVFTLTLSGLTPATVIVPYSVVFLTAESGDITPPDIGASATIAPNTLTQTISIPIIGDAIDEDDETFSVVLGTPSGATVDPAGGSATGTITDDDDPPSVTIGDIAEVEGNSGGTKTLSFPVTLSAASEKTVTVKFSTADGTATAGSDYTAVVNGVVTFNPGETNGQAIVQIIGDTDVEPDETLTVTLADPNNATLGATTTATGTIANDDVRLSIAGPGPFGEQTGANHTVEFIVSLSSQSTETVTVAFATSDGTATGSPEQTRDYVPTSGTLTFLPGESTKTIAVTVVADARDDGDSETFNVTLSNPVNAGITGGAGTATATIEDDDLPPSVTIGDATVAEGAGTISFPVTLSSASNRLITVKFATANGTATAGSDYVEQLSGEVTFVPGDTSETIVVTILSDSAVEPLETFTVTLSDPSNATLGSASTGTGTITDDDLKLSISGPGPFGERTGANHTVEFTVSLSSPSTETVTVAFATSDGTARGNPDQHQDYLSNSGTLTFLPGESTKTIAVTVVADARDDGDSETFNVTLSNPVNAGIADGAGTATVTIEDDDPLPSVTVGDAATTEGADGATRKLFIPLTLSAASNRPVKVRLSTADGTALAGEDYLAATNRLVTFDPGVTTLTTDITLIGDSLIEGDETFTVTLSDPTDATLGAATTATGTIIDDDAVLSIDDPTIVEGDTGAKQIEFTVSISTAQTVDVTVRLNSNNITAIANEDFGEVNRQVTIPAGQTSVKTLVNIVGDFLPEGDETFEVVLSNPVNAVLGSKTKGIATITNDDSLKSISGHVYVDHDNDGLRDAGEKPLGGVLIRLTGTDLAGDTHDIAQLTAADGSYRFDNLVPGNYRVSESQPPGFLDGKDTFYNGVIAAENDLFILPLRGESRANNNFGERGAPPQQISKRLFFSSNAGATNVHNNNATPPTVDLAAVTSAINLANHRATTASGTGTPGAHIALVASDGSNSSAGRTTTVDAGGNWSISDIDVSGLADGTITYRVAAVDDFGNSAFDSLTAAKTTVAISFVTDPINAGNQTNVTVRGTGQKDVGAIVSVVVKSGRGSAERTTAARTTTIDANGNWEIIGIDVSALSDGTLRIIATATAGTDTAETTKKAIKGTT